MLVLPAAGVFYPDGPSAYRKLLAPVLRSPHSEVLPDVLLLQEVSEARGVWA